MIKPERRWAHEPGRAGKFCADCTARTSGDSPVFAVPVRFVMACQKGHLSEFPWDYWVEHREGCTQRGKGLLLRSEGPGLAGLILSCPACKNRRPMDGIFSRRTWEGRLRCEGKRPWLAEADEACDRYPVALQRGASNLYFPVVASALSIPPWTDRLMQVLGDWWATVSGIVPAQRTEWIRMSANSPPVSDILAELQMTPEELSEAVNRRMTAYQNMDVQDLKPEEYRQLLSPAAGQERDPDFEVRNESVPDQLSPWVYRIVRAVRLREVRALRGFTRINPPGDPDSGDVCNLSAEGKDWLPAIEVRGEGIFLALDETSVSKWECRPDVISRVRVCEERHVADWKQRYGADSTPHFEVTPRLMLCHSLSHALMRQLTLECGYSSASLQERIYSDQGSFPMAGLLIYTATPDADGTLGGLQRQGKRIAGLLPRAIAAIEWCSSDPLCITDMMGAISSYSRSTCHSCMLAPETSCESFNSFLDRALLTGLPENPELGFFHGILESV